MAQSKPPSVSPEGEAIADTEISSSGSDAAKVGVPDSRSEAGLVKGTELEGPDVRRGAPRRGASRWRETLLSRRSFILGGIVTVLGSALLPPVRERFSVYADDLVGGVADRTLDALGTGVVQVTRVDEFIDGGAYGTIPNTYARSLLGKVTSQPVSRAEQEDWLREMSFVPSLSTVFLTLVTARDDVSFVGIRFRAAAREQMGKRRLVVWEGGGDGTEIHAYIATDASGGVLIRYSLSGVGGFRDSIRLPLDAGSEYALEVSFAPTDAYFYEWSFDILFYRSRESEYSQISYGPYRTGGIPEGDDEISLGSDPRVKPRTSGLYIHSVFPELTGK